MSNLVNTNIPWLPYLKADWKVLRVKNAFYASKEKAHQETPTILSLARSGVKIRDISNNEGQLAESYYDYNPVKPGDLLLNPMDLYSGANCNVSEVEGVISPAYANLRSKIKLEPRFFDYYFKTQYWTMAMFAHGKGVSFDNRWTLNNETLMSYELPFPTFEEQEKIVHTLKSKIDKIDELILIQERQISSLKEYKQCIITKAVTKGLNTSSLMKESSIEFIGLVPKHWKILKTKRITIDHLQGYYDKDGYTSSGFRLLRITDLQDDGRLSIENSPFVKETNTIHKFILEKGDFCFARTGGAGLFGFIDNEIEPSVFASYLIRFRFKKQYNPFLKYVFLSNSFQQEIDSLIHGAVNRNVHAENILETHISIPPKEEQIQIVEYLDNKCDQINNLISIKLEKIEKLQEYKKSLIYEYVTGKKEV